MQPSTQAIRIFLVEDSPIIRENLIGLFDDLIPSELVGWAADQDEAMGWLTANADGWDLAVVDLFLKTGNGIAILQRFKTRKPLQKMVVLSNYATARAREQCLSAGADAIFDKSQELESFVDFALALTRAGAAHVAEPRHSPSTAVVRPWPQVRLS